MYLSTKFIAVAFLACVSAAPVLEIRTPLFGGKAAAPPNALPAGAPVYHKKLKRFYAPKWIPGGNGVKAQVEDKIAEFWAKDKERQRYHSVIYDEKAGGSCRLKYTCDTSIQLIWHNGEWDIPGTKPEVLPPFRPTKK